MRPALIQTPDTKTPHTHIKLQISITDDPNITDEYQRKNPQYHISKPNLKIY